MEMGGKAHGAQGWGGDPHLGWTESPQVVKVPVVGFRNGSRGGWG